ncbi:MAG: hypothetical protein HY913_18875 [Desulfomonile tiedjei]|nr:hypothetical protein [Desulfomonile tiedjei]
MTQIVGDATHIKGRLLSGNLSSGQTWVSDGSRMVPAGNEAYKFIDVEGNLLTATGSEDTLYLSGVSGIALALETSSGTGTSSIRLEVSGLVSGQIPDWSAISGTAWGGSGIAEGGSGMAAGASGIATGASGIAVAASGMASGGSGTATQALGIAVGSSGIAVGASGIAAGGSGIAAGTSGVAVGASGMAHYASGKLDDTDQTSGIVLSSGNGFMVFSASPLSGQVLKASGSNLLTDLYWAVDQTGSGGGSGSGNSYAFINVQGATIAANTGDDILNFSGRSGIFLAATSGDGQGQDIIFAEVSGLASGQIPNWSDISGAAYGASGIAVGASGIALAGVTPDYLPPRFVYKDTDEIYIPRGRYYKAGFRWRGQFQGTASIAQYWDVSSRFSAKIDSTYSPGTSPGMIGGAKVANSWYSVFLVGNSPNDVLVLPFVRVKAISYSSPNSIINPGNHNSAANYEDGFFLSNGAWNDYRLVKRSCDSNDGSVHTIADTINAAHDEIRIVGDLTAELAANDWLQLVPPPTMPCLFLGLVRIDASGNLGECRSVASEAASTGEGIKEVVEGRLAWGSDTELAWNPVRGYGAALWMSDDWRVVTPSHSITMSNTAIDIDGNTLTDNANYDVFAEGDGSPFNFRLVAKRWTNDTTRAQNLARLDGVLVYDKDTDIGRRRRFLGTVRLRNDAGTPKFTDSVTKRFISNIYNSEQVRVAASAQANGAAVADDSYAPWTNWGSPGIGAVFAGTQTFAVFAPFGGQTDPANAAGRLSVVVALDGAPGGVEGSTPGTAGIMAIARQPMYIIEIAAPGYHFIDLYRKRFVSGTSPLHWAVNVEGTILA